MTAAYRLAQAGVARRRSTSARPTSAGSSAPSTSTAPRSIASTTSCFRRDDRVLGLAEELGLGDRSRFRPTKVGFYDDGRLFSMTSPKEFLTFPLLRPHERVRLAPFVARCQLTKDARRARRRRRCSSGCSGTAARASSRSCGSRCSTRSSTATSTTCPATYIWARTRRMGSTRDKSGREVMGWLEGGYQTLIDALENEIVALGGEVHAGATVEQIAGRRAAAPSVSSSTVASGRFDSRPLHAGAADGAPAARARARRAGAGRPLPLPRRRLPAAPRRRGASARTTT